jgi:uroporphyrinogen-III decarboxylase
MGIRGLLLRSSLPLLIRLSTLKGKGGSSLFTPKVKKGVTVDPLDPKTWWMSHAAKSTTVIPIMAQMYDHAMSLAGVPARKFYSDAKTHVNTVAAVAAYYGLDSAIGGGDTYNYEVEALGQKMIYSENAMPTIDFRDPFIKEPADLAKLKPPDWLNAGRIPFVLDVIRLNAGMGYKTGKFCSPFSLAVALRTYPKLIRDMRKNPQFAHDLFTVLVDEILPSYLKVQKKQCGIKVAAGADAWAVFPNLSPELMEKWVVPYAERLFKNCTDFGVISMAVGGGGDYCEESIEKFDKDILFKCFDIQKKLFLGTPMIVLGMGRWHEYPLETVTEYLMDQSKKGTRASIVASLNARLLRDGPVDKIVDTIIRYMDVLGREHNLAISLANIPADTPPRHIHAAVAATHTYGRLPLARNLEEIPLKVPERESFQEYVEKMSSGKGLNI